MKLRLVGVGQNIYHVCSGRCRPEDLWTCRTVGCGLWTEYLSSIMCVAGGVDLWTCGPMGRRENICHICSRRCGPVDLKTCGHVDMWICAQMGCGC